MQTLKDKLSRLTFRQACKWLGADGETLLKAGGKRSVDLEEQVHLSDDGFTLTLPGAAVTISPDLTGPQSVRLKGGVLLLPSRSRHRPRGGRHEDVPGNLLGQAVVTQGGPMTDGRRLDEGHRDLELVNPEIAARIIRKQEEP